MILASQENIQKWTASGAWGTKTFIDYFKGHVRKDPDKVCLVDPLNKEALLGLKPERLTYRELDRAVDAVAEGLLAKVFRRMTSSWSSFPTAGNWPCSIWPSPGWGAHLSDAHAMATF